MGILGIIISCIFLGIIIYKTLIISKKYNLNSYNELLNKIIKSEIIKKIIKIIINIFLLSSFYVMVAGLSAYFYQQYQFNKIIISTLFIIVCYMIFNKNVERVIQINTAIVPVIIIIFIIFGFKNINYIDNEVITLQNNPKWIISAIIYTSYNSITLIGLTGIMNKYLKNKNNCLAVAVITTTIIVSLAMIIFFLLMNVEEVVEIPMLYVANKFGGIYMLLYNTIILMAIFTTAISQGYSFLENVCGNNTKLYKSINKIICLAGIPISLVGFSNLVNTIYPVFGVVGLLQIAYILLKK